MHISEGYLSGPVLITGAALAAAGTAVGLKKLDYDRIAQAGILAAAFFTASLVHLPAGPTNVHLIMNGIIGLLLGWGAFPVILVALLLQGILFQFGGITTLGVNTLIMATPAVMVHYMFGRWVNRPGWVGTAAAFSCGAGAVAFSSILLAVSLIFTDEKFFSMVVTYLGAHTVVMAVEGAVSVVCVGFFLKVKPELLPVSAGKQKRNTP